MKKKDVIYCIHCGKENDKNVEYCKYCDKLITDKDHDIYEIVADEAWDKTKGDFLDKAKKFVKGYVNKYFYGTVFTLALVGTIVGTSLSLNSEEIPIATNKRELFNEKEAIRGCWKGEIRPVLNNYQEWYFNVEKDKINIYYTDVYNENGSVSVNSREDRMDLFFDKHEDGYYLDLAKYLYGKVDFNGKDNFTITSDLTDESLVYNMERTNCDVVPKGEGYIPSYVTENFGNNYTYNYEKLDSENIVID